MKKDVLNPAAQTLLVFAVTALCLCWKLGGAPLAGTEGHRALPAHEMAQHGGWLVPRLYGEVYLRKPPLHYWVLAAAETAAGGPGELAWRLPSALGASALGAFLCAMAIRWFGRGAGLPAGFAHLALFALWSQSRSADIDALHTLAAVVCACGLIELGLGAERPRRAWAVLTALSFGSALLLKGPACLPAVAGTLIGMPLAGGRRDLLRRGSIWLALAAGALLFAAWAAAVLLALKHGGWPVDVSGIEEVGSRFRLRSLSQAGRALVLPLELLALSLPLSALGFVFWRNRRLYEPSPSSDIAKVLCGAVVGAFALGVFAGVTNVRYGYATLPLLAPLAGFVADRARGKDGTASEAVGRISESFLAIASLAAGAMAVYLGALTGRIAFGAGVLALTAAGALLWRRARTLQGPANAYLLPVAVAAALAFGQIKNDERTRRSARGAAAVVRQVAGPGATLSADTLIRTHPELFHYAGAAVERFRMTDAGVSGGRPDGWYAFSRGEWSRVRKISPDAFTAAATLPTHVPGAVLARRISPSSP